MLFMWQRFSAPFAVGHHVGSQVSCSRRAVERHGFLLNPGTGCPCCGHADFQRALPHEGDMPWCYQAHKGTSAPPLGLSRACPAGGALPDNYYDEEELPWEVVEKAARDKIARNWRPGKKQLVLAGVEHLPGRKMRASVVFEGIPRRRNVLLTGSRPEKMSFCDRVITEDFVQAHECRAIVNAMQTAIRNFLAQGPDVSFIPLQPSTEEMIGSYAYGLILSALHKMRMELVEDYRVPSLYFAGALLSRLAEAGGSESDPVPNNAYFNPHIDKANKKEYDYSAILYLNTQAADGEDATAAIGSLTHFTGGSLVFLDGDADRVVQPVAGRLVAFTSGFENPHQVRRVRAGHRFALSAWFTTDPKLSYPTQV